MVSNISTGTPLENILAQANLNRINQRTPTGSVTFSGPGRNTLDLTLPPSVQALLDERIGVSGDALSLARTGLADFGTGGEASRRRAEEAAFNRSLGLVSPELERLEEATRTRLINRGLDERGESFLDQFNQQVSEPRNRLLESLALGSVAEGRTEQQSQINLIDSILGLQQEQPPEIRDFIAPQPVDVLGPESLRFQQNLAAQNNALAQDQLKAAQEAADLGNLSRLGSAAITGIVQSGGLGNFLKTFGIGNGNISGDGGAIDTLVKGAVDAGKSLAEFFGDFLGGGTEGTQAAGEVLQTVPGIDTNLINAPSNQLASLAPDITNLASDASLFQSGFDPAAIGADADALLASRPDLFSGQLSTFAGDFAIDATTGAALGSASAIQAAGLIGAGEASTLAAAGFTGAEIASMNATLATTSTAGTGAAGAGGITLGAAAGIASAVVFAASLVLGKRGSISGRTRGAEAAGEANLTQGLGILGVTGEGGSRFVPGSFEAQDEATRGGIGDDLTGLFKFLQDPSGNQGVTREDVEAAGLGGAIGALGTRGDDGALIGVSPQVAAGIVRSEQIKRAGGPFVSPSLLSKLAELRTNRNAFSGGRLTQSELAQLQAIPPNLRTEVEDIAIEVTIEEFQDSS